MSGLLPIYLGVSAGQPHSMWTLVCVHTVPATVHSGPVHTLPLPSSNQTTMQQATSTHTDSALPTSSSTPTPLAAHMPPVTATPSATLPQQCNCGTPHAHNLRALTSLVAQVAAAPALRVACNVIAFVHAATAKIPKMQAQMQAQQCVRLHLHTLPPASAGAAMAASTMLRVHINQGRGRIAVHA